MDESSIIKEGNQVFLRRADCSRIFVVRSKRQVTFEKMKFNLDGLIGQRFGTTFELKSGELVKVDPAQEAESDKDVTEAGQDNRKLVGSGENQKLGQDEIEQMKEKGMAGDVIVEQLVENSETFKTKTKFSQEKYIKKKKKKYLMMFTALRPTARLLIEMYHAKHGPKICNLRADSLSQILAYSNAMAGNTVAVVDTCQGLVLAAVMERLGGHGTVINFHAGDSPSRQAVDYMDFPKQFTEKLFEIPLHKVSLLSHGATEDEALKEDKDSDEVHTSKQVKGDNSLTARPVAPVAGQESKEEPMAVDNEESDGAVPAGSKSGSASSKAAKEGADDKKANGNEMAEHKKRKHPAADWEAREANRERKARQLEIVKGLFQSQKFDSLIVACKFFPTPIVLELLKGVSPSRPVIVFSQHKEPLVDCWQAVRERGLAIKFKLTETWLRYLQVLPARTHPLNNMSGTGGYLLTFTTVSCPAKLAQ